MSPACKKYPYLKRYRTYNGALWACEPDDTLYPKLCDFCAGYHIWKNT